LFKESTHTYTYDTNGIVLAVHSLNSVLILSQHGIAKKKIKNKINLPYQVAAVGRSLKSYALYNSPIFFFFFKSKSASFTITPLHIVASAVDKRDGVCCARVCPLQSTWLHSWSQEEIYECRLEQRTVPFAL